MTHQKQDERITIRRKIGAITPTLLGVLALAGIAGTFTSGIPAMTSIANVEAISLDSRSDSSPPVSNQQATSGILAIQDTHKWHEAELLTFGI